jgi:hypothetical protein|tara:strand:- start:948 stop:1187 length:240 start_codon:yes stop_codon:yes gene_type:complete
MKIRILKQTTLGSTVVRVGDVIEASLPNAQFLIGIKKAEEWIEPSFVKEEPVADPEVLSCPPTKPPSKRRKTNATKSGL